MSPPLTDAQLNELLEEIPVLAGRPRQLQELSGGLTNRNVKVTTADGMYVGPLLPTPPPTCSASTATASITTPRPPRRRGSAHR